MCVEHHLVLGSCFLRLVLALGSPTSIRAHNLSHPMASAVIPPRHPAACSRAVAHDEAPQDGSSVGATRFAMLTSSRVCDIPTPTSRQERHVFPKVRDMVPCSRHIARFKFQQLLSTFNMYISGIIVNTKQYNKFNKQAYNK